MRPTAAILLVVAASAAAIPREVVRTRCLRASQSCLQDDLGPVCVTELAWVTRDGPRGADIFAPSCHQAVMTHWLGFEWYDRNADGKPGYFQMADAP